MSASLQILMINADEPECVSVNIQPFSDQLISLRIEIFSLFHLSHELVLKSLRSIS